jgi:hypothetical protein
VADAAVQSVPQQVEAARRWSLAQRVLFRFVGCYWLLYTLPGPLTTIPGAQFVFRPYLEMWHGIVPWVATHVFFVTGRAATYFPTGSGDTTLAYIRNLLDVAVALAAALVWSVLDRRRADYRTLHGWLRLLVRYTLAFALFSYGFLKVLPLQFEPPRFAELIEPYGEFSPMHVLWNFMGSSKAYTIFSGAAEVAGGFLLLFRRTTSLGAMVSFAVLLNIVALNFCYDVPVKLYSTNLALMAFFLLAPDLRRLANALVLNRAAPPADLTPRFERRWLRVAVMVFWMLFVGYKLFGSISGSWQRYKQTYINPQRPPLYGLYDVSSFTRDGRELPPVDRDWKRWRKVAIDFPAFLTIRMMDDTVRRYPAQYDAAKSTITLDKKGTLTYSRPDADHVVLQGTMSGSPATIQLVRIDPSTFLLFNRGFHWISELPFNR